jgi:hypothetical protein
MKSQKQRILDYLKSGKVLTRLNSWEELGVLEAPARISELRQDGYAIHTEMVSVKNRYFEDCRIARWSLDD